MTVTLYMAISADGYITSGKDDTPWSEAVWEHYYALVQEKGNLIVGERTYRLMKAADEFSRLADAIVIVVTKDVTKHDDPNRVFVSSPQMALDVLEERHYDEALVGGGSILNASFLKGKFLDELILDVEPLLFGGGLRLFAETDAEMKLNLLGFEKLSGGALSLHYRVVRQQ